MSPFKSTPLVSYVIFYGVITDDTYIKGTLVNILRRVLVWLMILSGGGNESTYFLQRVLMIRDNFLVTVMFYVTLLERSFIL